MLACCLLFIAVVVHVYVCLFCCLLVRAFVCCLRACVRSYGRLFLLPFVVDIVGKIDIVDFVAVAAAC